MRKILFVSISLFLLLIVVSCVSNKSESSDTAQDNKVQIAEKPPMGWNSFDSYDCRINEKEFKATVDYMAENLLQYGWEYAVIDYIWWHPAPGNWDTPRRFGHPSIRFKENGDLLHPEYITMDKYGRLLPSVERFPSAANGVGFKALGDYVHSKGMKFGIHIMRGIHRKAYTENTEIMGSDYSAAQIGESFDTCRWCNQMYGVDASKPGAQEYYNSLFNLYAQWGVDFIKADDMMFPPYHKGEIEMMHKAIKNCGRPIVLSLSCGEAPLGRAEHLKSNANTWRISADFWDKWDNLEHNFDLLNAWSSHIGEGRWPDADMIPFGRISLNNRPGGPERESKFTWAEHYTLMTLWCMARSPLMIGADLLSSSEQSLSFFKNPEVLAVNQHSTDNRQVSKNKSECCWVATDPDTGDKYIALFNLTEKTRKVSFDLERESLRGEYKLRDLWQRKDVGNTSKRLNAELEAHGAALFRLSEIKE